MLAQHSWAWQKLLATFGGFRWRGIGVFDGHAEMIGCIPFCEAENGIGRVIMSSPMPASYGGVLHIEDCDKDPIYAILIESLLDYARGNNVDIITIFTSPFREDIGLYRKYFDPTYSVEKFYQYLPGKMHPQNNSKSKFKNNLSRNIKRAQNHGMQLKCAESSGASQIKKWYSEVLTKRFDDIGADPPSCLFLLKIVEALGPEKLGEFSFIEYEGEMAAGGIFLYAWAQDIYLRAASTKYLKMGASIFLDCMMIEKGYELKVSAHNFQSSPSRTSPSYEYKRQWGCTEANTYYLVKVLTAQDKFIRLGKEVVSQLFPYFFVLPYSVYS